MANRGPVVSITSLPSGRSALTRMCGGAGNTKTLAMVQCRCRPLKNRLGLPAVPRPPPPCHFRGAGRRGGPCRAAEIRPLPRCRTLAREIDGSTRRACRLP